MKRRLLPYPPKALLVALVFALYLCVSSAIPGGKAKKDEASATAETEADVTTDKAPPRMIAKEELARHDGNQTSDRWLSIMSQVYDVTAGDQFYGEKGPYRVFVGSNANIPFITGTFTKEEAEKPITELDKTQLMNLQSWAEFYEGEEKYPFIGLLIGELYGEDGQPTEQVAKMNVLIEEAKAEAAEKKRQRKERIAQKRKENEEKKKLLEQQKKDEL